MQGRCCTISARWYSRFIYKTGHTEREEWKLCAVTRSLPMICFPHPVLRPALEIPYCHHENWDGTGYSHGLKEKRYLWKRIFAVVDVYDALTSDRPCGRPGLKKTLWNISTGRRVNNSTAGGRAVFKKSPIFRDR